MGNEIALLLIFLSGLMIVGCGCGLIFWYFVFFKFKHTVELISLHNETEKIRIKKAQDHVLKDTGAKVWKVRWCKDVPTIPVPPNYAIKITDKGKNFVRAYVTETGDIIFADAKHPKLIPHINEILRTIPDWIENIPSINERQQQYDKWKLDQINEIKQEAGDNHIIFKPYTTNHRVMQVLQVQKAAQRRKKSRAELLQMIVNTIPVLVLALVIVVGLIFWQDLAKPSLDKQAQITAQEAERTQQWRIIQEISQDVQEIKQTDSNDGTDPPY